MGVVGFIVGLAESSALVGIGETSAVSGVLVNGTVELGDPDGVPFPNSGEGFWSVGIESGNNGVTSVDKPN